jgi:hypothetical protein
MTFTVTDITNPASPTTGGGCAFTGSGSTRTCTTGNAYPHGGTFRVDAAVSSPGLWTTSLTCLVPDNHSDSGSCSPTVSGFSAGSSSNFSADSSSSASDVSDPKKSGSSMSAPAPEPTPDATPEPTPTTPEPTPAPVADTSGPALTATVSGEEAAGTITGQLGTAAGDLNNVQISADNGAELTTPTVGADGHFSAGITVKVGTTKVTITQADEAGNISTVVLTIVRNAPAAEESAEPPAVTQQSTEPGTEPNAG